MQYWVQHIGCMDYFSNVCCCNQPSEDLAKFVYSKVWMLKISRILLFFGYVFQPQIESWQFRPKKELANCSFKKKESCYGKFGSMSQFGKISHTRMWLIGPCLPQTSSGFRSYITIQNLENRRRKLLCPRASLSLNNP
jgi:hypothetical protein